MMRLTLLTGLICVALPAPAALESQLQPNVHGDLTLQNSANSADQASTGIRETAIAGVEQVLGSFTTTQGFLRKYLLVKKELTDIELIGIARQLHALEPDIWYHLMDSDEQFDTMLSALPATANGDYSAWPSQYMEDHFVARIMLEIRSDGKGGAQRNWMLEGGPKRSHLAADL